MSRPEHFSKDWVEQLNRVVPDPKDPDDLTPSLTLCIEYRITQGPIWHLLIKNGQTRFQKGPASDPDVSFTTDRATAESLTMGSVDPLQAVIAGDLSISGDPRRLSDYYPLLTDFQEPIDNDQSSHYDHKNKPS